MYTRAQHKIHPSRSHIIGAWHKTRRNQAESSRRTDEFELAVELLLAYVVYSNTGKRSTSKATSTSTVSSTSTGTSISTARSTSTVSGSW